MTLSGLFSSSGIFAVDPLFLGGVGVEEVLIVIIKVVAAFALLLLSVVFMIWFERKLIGDMQNRIGPNVAGPFGVLQTLADGLKLFSRKTFCPPKAAGWFSNWRRICRWCRPS